MTAPYRPAGSKTLASSPRARRAAPRSPCLPIFSTPMARPIDASPALMAMDTDRTAVAPVAQALATLNTGMPVWPICFWMRWPTMAPASLRLPTASTSMSCTVMPPSPSAASAASAPRSTTSLPG